MFTENKYSRWYFKIVESARLVSRAGYVEEHHIIPKSMGGLDTPENIVKLSAREHFLVHLLLTKFVTDKKALMQARKAVRLMMVAPKHLSTLRWIPTSRTIEIARKEAALANKGNVEIAAKISKSMTGRILSDEHCANISASLQGYVKNPEVSQKISATLTNKPKSEHHRRACRDRWARWRADRRQQCV